MKKRFISILLVLCMALALLPGTAWAAATSGKCGANVTWAYSNGVLTIQGTGNMDSYNYYEDQPAPWDSYSNKINSVKIGAGVTSVGGQAFNGFSALASVTIPDSVTSIGERAFISCGLTSVTIPDSVIYLGAHAFNGCSKLTTLTFGKGITSFSAWEFNGCSSLKSVTIPAGVTHIGIGTFAHCYGLNNVTIPASVTSIGQFAFMDCSSLTDIYYGGSESQWRRVEIIETDNAPLLNAKIHYNSTGHAPAASTAISVTVNGKAVVWTDAEPFLANGRTMVPLRAVGDALGLTVDWDSRAREAIFTNGQKTIYFPIDSKIARTSDGKSIEMDTTAVLKGGRTYAPIRYLAEYFGFTVDWDNGTRTVLITDGISGKCGDNLTWSLNQSTGVLTISGTGAMSDYQEVYGGGPFYTTAPWWNYRLQIKKVVVEDGVTHIGNNAFCADNPFSGELFYENLTDVILAGSVTSIGTRAFWTGYLQTVQLGTGLRVIGDEAFFANQGIKEISLPDTLTTIGKYAFGLTSMTAVTIPYSVTSIGEGAFGYNYVAEGGPVASMSFTIVGYRGSAAESYYKQMLQDYNARKAELGQYAFYSDNYTSGGTIYFTAR